MSRADDIHHVLIPFEEQLGDIISHPIYRIDAHGGAGLSRGRVGNALHLDGRSQYAVIENQEDSCMGNLERWVLVPDNVGSVLNKSNSSEPHGLVCGQENTRSAPVTWVFPVISRENRALIHCADVRTGSR